MTPEYGVVIISALLGSMAFMARHYFLRVERHLVRLHQLFSVIGALQLRVGNLELRVFGKTFDLPREIGSEQSGAE